MLISLLSTSLFICFASAQLLYPSDLIDRIRFHHLQEVFYNTDAEVSLRQAEEYLAHDLVESIEDLSFSTGVVLDHRFLPPTHIARFRGWQRIESKYKNIPYPNLLPFLIQQAYRVYDRQRLLTASAITIDDLESDWLEWYESILATSRT